MHDPVGVEANNSMLHTDRVCCSGDASSRLNILALALKPKRSVTRTKPVSSSVYRPPKLAVNVSAVCKLSCKSDDMPNNRVQAEHF